MIPRIAPGTLLASLLVLTVSPSRGLARPASPPASPARVTSFDLSRRLDVGALNMVVTNFGSFAYDLAMGAPGLEFPRGSGKSVMFSSGLWIGAPGAGLAIVTVSDYSSEYAPGPYLWAGGSGDPAMRVWKVSAWHGSPQDTAHVEHTPAEIAADPRLDPIAHHSWSEYLANAAPLGAPVRNWRLPDTSTPDPSDSVDVPGPDVRGDQMLWSIYNDGDLSLHTNPAGSTGSLGVEVRQTVWGLAGPGPFQNVAFVHFEIVARAGAIDGLRAAIWADPDIGGFTDDLTGCDPPLHLGYAYNATNNDAIYGSQPPAVGVAMLPSPAAFGRYINGTDPTSATQTFNYMKGLAADGSPVVDPITGYPTTFWYSGDPVSLQGWLDSAPADRRFLLTGPSKSLATGDTLTLDAAVVVAQGTDRLQSITLLRQYSSDALAYLLTGAPGDTVPPPPTSPCPRTRAFWAAACPPSAPPTIDLASLDAAASYVSNVSRVFEWSTAHDGLCAVLNPAVTDERSAARAEYATLLANLGAGLLSLDDASGFPIRLFAGTPIDCPGVPAHDIAGLLAPPMDTSRVLASTYTQADPGQPRGLHGVDWGGPAFEGGAGYGLDFLGSTLDPAFEPDSFPSVELRFGAGHAQKAYRYLRLEQQDGSPPVNGREYRYAGYVDVPLEAWDVQRGVRLQLAYVERAVSDADGTLLPPEFQPATFDSTWAPDSSALGSREYLLALRPAYDPTPDPSFAVDGAPIDGTLPVLYALWSFATGSYDGDVLDLFPYTPVDTTFESLMLRLESQPLSDPAVRDAYRAISSCFQALNSGYGLANVCDAPTPVQVSRVTAEATDAGVSLAWSVVGDLGALALERRADAADWAPLATLTPDGTGRAAYLDATVEPGHGYGYRVREGAGGAVLDEVTIVVPARGVLALEGLRPNPVSGAPTVWLSLPVRAPARLEMLDVAGRRVVAREVGGLGAGRHAVPLEEGARLPAGVYFLRLSQGRAQVRARAVLMR